MQLRTSSLVLGSEEERIKRQHLVLQTQKELIELTRTESLKALIRDDYDLAIPAALQALRISLDVHGQGKIELVPAYLLLGEASIGKGMFSQAEEYLSMAKWVVLKHDDCSNEIKSQLHRNMGKLYTAQGKYEEALRQLSNDVYYSSLVYGPRHVRTSPGYFYMGQAFAACRNVDRALVFYGKLQSIWEEWLSDIMSRQDDVPTEELLDEAECVEAADMLEKITRFREGVMGPAAVATAEALYVQGLFHYYVEDLQKALEMLEQAERIFQVELGDDHKTSEHCRQWIARTEEEIRQKIAEGEGEMHTG